MGKRGVSPFTHAAGMIIRQIYNTQTGYRVDRDQRVKILFPYFLPEYVLYAKVPPRIRLTGMLCKFRQNFWCMSLVPEFTVIPEAHTGAEAIIPDKSFIRI